jgi:serine/threonine-protein kinase
VLRALAQKPVDRFVSAADFEGALAGVGGSADTPPLNVPPRNQHPLLACYCPTCGREPTHDAAIYCGLDGATYHVAMLRIVPKHRPPTTVYVDRREATLGRNDPDAGWYPELDLTACDPARHVSRRHLKLARDGARFSATALSAVNGTRCNGVPLPADTTAELTPGSRLELGDLVATLMARPVLDAPPDTPAPTDGGAP